MVMTEFVDFSCANCGKQVRDYASNRLRKREPHWKFYCSRKCKSIQQTGSLQDTDKFWSRVQKSDGCWLWTGALSGTGYGNLRIGGKYWRAHQVSWVLTYGEIPKGIFVLHKCDNPPCVRPDHLFLGTGLDNTRDASRKYRLHPGERNWSAKLTEDQVKQIRSKQINGRIDVLKLALEFGCSPLTINDIITRRTWRHI